MSHANHEHFHQYNVRVPDELTQRVTAGVVAGNQNLEKELGVISITSLVLGMQCQLGNIAALTMAIPGHEQEIVDHLICLTAMGMIYLKALAIKEPDDVNETPECPTVSDEPGDPGT